MLEIAIKFINFILIRWKVSNVRKCKENKRERKTLQKEKNSVYDLIFEGLDIFGKVYLWHSIVPSLNVFFSLKALVISFIEQPDL